MTDEANNRAEDLHAAGVKLYDAGNQRAAEHGREVSRRVNVVAQASTRPGNRTVDCVAEGISGDAAQIRRGVDLSHKNANKLEKAGLCSRFRAGRRE